MTERDVYSVEEFCERQGICRMTFYKLIRKQGLPTIKYGSRRLIPKAAFEKWQQRQIVVRPVGR